MTIGIDCRLYSPKHTGIGRYVAELVKNLTELDQKNHYILYFNQTEFEKFKVPNERWKKKLVDIAHYSWAEQWKWYWILRKEEVGLMHFPHFNVPILYKRPFIVTIHDLTLHYYPYKSYQPRKTLRKMLQIWVYRFLMGRVVRHAKRIISVSDNTKKDLLREYPSLDEKKITTILEGVPESFQKASEEQIVAVLAKYEINRPYLLYTGVWRSHKNLLRLIKAFKKLSNPNKKLQLVITGKKDPSYPEIPALIQELDLEKRVILTGFVSDEELIALTSGAMVFVFPSLYEGFGLPPLEAMQLEVPVVASNTSSIPEVCADAALYFDPNNVDDMAEKMTEIVQKETLQELLVEKGRENLKRFSWRKMATDILDKYQNM